VWIEPVTGAEARGVRRWARRQLPARIGNALFILVLASVFLLALGRLVDGAAMPIGCFTNCQQSDPNDSKGDLWDAIF
jgi:hypothetical protein